MPVREALRILESQGLVVNEPYKGIRLTPVTHRAPRPLIEARVALETTRGHRAIARRAATTSDGLAAAASAASTSSN